MQQELGGMASWNVGIINAARVRGKNVVVDLNDEFDSDSENEDVDNWVANSTMKSSEDSQGHSLPVGQ